MFRFWRQWPYFQKGCASRSSWLEAVVIPVWVLASDHGCWYSTGFDVWYQIYLFVATWCCMGGWCSCWYSTIVRSVAQRQCRTVTCSCVTTHTWLPLPLCTLPIVVLGPSSLGEGARGLKPAGACCLLQGSLRLLRLETPIWATYTYCAALAGSGRWSSRLF